MYKTCKTPQSAGRQRNIANTFLSLLQTKAFESITVHELCEKCNIPRKAFYRYFDCKDDIFIYLADTSCWDFENYQRYHNTDKKRTSVGDVENLFSFWLSRRALLEAVRKSQKSTVFIDRIAVNTIKEKTGLRLSGFQDHTLQETSIIFSLAGIFSLLYMWCDSGFLNTPQEMAQICVNLLTRPLFIKQ